MPLPRHLQQTTARVSRLIDSVCAKWPNWISSPAIRSTHPDAPPGEMMATPSPHDVTQLLLEWRNGEQQALEKLTPLVYGELRRLARRYLRHERADHTLQATALVNEAYLQLVN